jgi:hypothetical protein
MGTSGTSIRAALTDAVVAAVPVAIVYFSGWAYLSSYLGEFGIDATQVDITFTTVLVYAFIPLQAPCLLGAMAVVAFVAYLCSLTDTSKVWAKNLAGLGILAIIVGLLFAVKWAANDASAEMAKFVWRGEKSQTISIVAPSSNSDAAYQVYKVCRDGRRLRQIIGLTDQMFLLCRSTVTPCTNGTMFAINTDGTINYMADRARERTGNEDICTK